MLAVLTHENAPRLQPIPEKMGETQFRGEGGITETRQPLQNATIEYAGQPLAVVVADTHERARYAASLVRVTYAEQQARSWTWPPPAAKPCRKRFWATTRKSCR